MHINSVIFRELIKRGYSRDGKKRVWDVSQSKLWYLTPELVKGYLNLKRYSPYRKRVINDEVSLLQKHMPAIVEQFWRKGFNIIDLGCGEGSKAEVLIKLLPSNVKVRYCPVDVSSLLLQMAKNRVKSLRSPQVTSIKPLHEDFIESPYVLGMLRATDFQHNFALLLGETISHYDIHEVLFKLSNTMLNDDYLIIGNGIRKGKRFVNLPKYKDPLFHQWFVHIMRGLGFEDDEVAVDARFAHGRLEGFYHVLKDKTITYNGRSLHFKKNDEVIVAIQYKFFEHELKKYCAMYFSSVNFYKNKENEYSLIVCRK